MPIRKELRQFYGPRWREITRPRILARAGNKCENCQKPNATPVESRYAWAFSRDGMRERRMWWRVIESEEWRNQFGEIQTPPQFYSRETVSITGLGIAHLNHVPGDDRDENLKALCQWCHLMHDRERHHETRGDRKDATRPLLA